MKKAKCPSGLTLVEMLVVMAVLAVTATLAGPVMAGWLQDIRAATLANTLLADLHLARSEAIKRGSPIVLCRRAGDACGLDGGWEQGWLMFSDSNGNGRLDPGEEVIRVAPAAPADWLMQGNTPVSEYVSYHPMGRTRMINGAFQAGTVTICRAGGTEVRARRVIINSMGRPRSQKAVLDRCA